MIKNNVSLFGNVGADAKVTDFDNGRSVVEFRLATNESWKNKEGEWESSTQWHSCKAFRKTGSTGVSEYLKKGATVNLMGSLKYQEREIGETKVQVAFIDVEDFDFVNAKKEDSSEEAK